MFYRKRPVRAGARCVVIQMAAVAVDDVMRVTIIIGGIARSVHVKCGMLR